MKTASALLVIAVLLVACGPQGPESPDPAGSRESAPVPTCNPSITNSEPVATAKAEPDVAGKGASPASGALPMPSGYSRELKVFFVEQRFRWEARVLNEALKRDKGLAYQGYFLDAQDGWSQPTSVWSDEVKHRIKPLTAPFYDSEHELMVSKKGDLIQLDYDVVIVGDVEPDSFLWHPEYWDWLEAWVKQGGGLILISGSAHNPRDYVNYESFRKLCPISLDFPAGYESAVNSNIVKHLARTPQGRDHELFNLASDESRRDELLGREVEGRFRPGALHGLYWYQVTGGAAEGATVLARVVREGGLVAEGEPLVVTKEYGKGRVLYLGTDDFHYWREFVGDYYFYKFWKNAIRWAANDPGK